MTDLNILFIMNSSMVPVTLPCFVRQLFSLLLKDKFSLNLFNIVLINGFWPLLLTFMWTARQEHTEDGEIFSAQLQWS